MKLDIKDNSLIITNNKTKEEVLNKLTSLVNVKFITKEEYIKKITFEFDEKTIYYIMSNYKATYFLARTYLNYLRYIDEKKVYVDKKLGFLCDLKKELLLKKIIKKDNLFIDYIKSKDIIVYNVNLKNEEKKLFLNATFINEDEYNRNNDKVYEFNSLDEETQFVAISIAFDIKNNIPLDKIVICNYSSDYYLSIKRIFKMLNIPINIRERRFLYSNPIVLKFIDILKTNYSFEETLNQIEDSEIKNDIIQICNKYLFKEVDDIIIECITSEFKSIEIRTSKLNNAVNIKELNEVEKDDIVYFIGFNEDKVPKVVKDEEYLSDKLKEELGLDTSSITNLNNKKDVIKKLNSLKNITLSYKLKSNKEMHYKSSLVEEMSLKVINNHDFDKYKYSNSYNIFSLAIKKDMLNKYNIVDSDLNKLLYNYMNNDYKSYSNNYNKINLKTLDIIKLSYTSMNSFYECQFKYYLNYILKIEKYEEKLSTKIGNAFHYVLSHYKDDNFDFESCYFNYLSKQNLTKKEKLIFEKLKSELILIIETINLQNSYTKLNEEVYEEEINVDIKENVVFSGKIDKIKFNESLATIIDYKTGKMDSKLDKINYGIGMQLPVYMYLIKNSDKFKNHKIIGIYLQKILNNDIPFEIDQDYEERKREFLKLDGYSINNLEYLEKLDFNYKNSKLIKSLAVKEDLEFYARSKVLSKEQLEELIIITENKIEECAKNIENNNFTINPKRSLKKFNSCDYCKFSDICFKKEEDYIDIIEQEV